MDMEQNNNRGFIPNFCDVTTVFMLVLLVELLALLLALAPSGSYGFLDRLAFISLFAQWLALLNASLLCLLKGWLNQQSVKVTSSVTLTLLLLVTLSFSLTVLYLGESLGLLSAQSSRDYYYFLLRVMAISSIIYAVILRYFYVQMQWRDNLQAQSHAQIQALKARIRPHFLFNSMNTIACLVHIDANRAEQAIEDLSDLFRASLREETSHSMGEELELTRSYVGIEQLRLDQRLQIEWDLDQAVMSIEVPTLCLQPLVENAIYHGVEPMPEGGRVKISAQVDNNRLCLSVSNPVYQNCDMSRHKGNHMAQANIKTRLALMYGDEAEFLILAEPTQYTVSIGIPIKT